MATGVLPLVLMATLATLLVQVSDASAATEDQAKAESSKGGCDSKLDEYLAKTQCKVRPFFVQSKTDGSCSRVEHLWENWRKGKFYKEEIIGQEEDDDGHANFHQFQTNDCIMAIFDEKVDFLDVRTHPATQATAAIKLPDGFKTKRATDNIVFLEKNSGILVFHLNYDTKETSLAHFFFFEDASKQEISVQDDAVKLINSKSPPHSHITAVDGTTFAGVIFNEEKKEYTLHIWDLDKGVKVKEEVHPAKENWAVKDLQITTTKNVVVVVEQNEERSFLIYNINTFSILPFKETVPKSSKYLVHKDFLAIRGNQLLNVYNYQTSENILKDESAYHLLEELNGNFVFKQGDVIKMFIPTTKKLITLFPENTIDFKVLSRRLVQLKKTYWEYEIWEFDGVETLTKTNMKFRFDACGYFLNNAHTRYIVRYSTGNVMHFW